MTRRAKGLLLAAAHAALVLSLGAKLLYDRATRPRVWARSAPHNPSLPIRGRYVSLRLFVDAPAFPLAKVASPAIPTPVSLSVENDRLVATPLPDATRFDRCMTVTVLAPRPDEAASFSLACPVLFFIPEHVADPSIRAPGEDLWVEVTIPRKGPPRPIRLGVKRGDGPILPIDRD